MLGVLCACGDAGSELRDEQLGAVREAQAAGDASLALHLARKALGHGDDEALALEAALACLELERWSEAVDFSRRGLERAGRDAGLTGDLNWAAGSGHMHLYLDLKLADDWRKANAAWERATTAGTHRADAAYGLTFIQSLEPMGSADRAARYGRLFLELAPGDSRAGTMRVFLDQLTAGDR